MKKLFIWTILLIVGVAFTAEAQKKKTYIKDVKFTFPAGGWVKYRITNEKDKGGNFIYVLDRESSSSSQDRYGGSLNEVDYTTCHLEGSLCEMRATLRANNTRLDVMGLDGVEMQSKPLPTRFEENGKYKYFSNTGRSTANFKTQGGNEYLLLGEFTPNEEIEIKFDIWEDDDMFGSGWSFDGTDDEHEDTVVKASAAQGHISYVQKAKGCLEVSYTIYQE